MGHPSFRAVEWEVRSGAQGWVPIHVVTERAMKAQIGDSGAFTALQGIDLQRLDLTVERYRFFAGTASVVGEVTKPSVRVWRKATISSSSVLVRPRLPICVVFRVGGYSGSGQQVTFSPAEPCAQRQMFLFHRRPPARLRRCRE